MARIIFLTDFSEAYARGLLLGIARYAHDTGQAWSLCRLPLSIRDKFGIEAVIDWALRMRADAVIGQFYNTDNVELFARNGIIAVAQDFKARFTTIPNITGPHYRAGQMGAEYFLKKGFRHFAFYGTRGIVWSDERYQGFRETVRRANPEFTFSALRNTSQTDLWLYDPIQLTTWLQSLPKPVAIMACDDNQAYHITEACLQAEGGGGGKFRIPDDIAVLIIGKTKCDEIKNEMRPSWRKAWSKRNATKISHTRKNTVRTTTKRCSNGIFLSQKQRSLRSLLVIANHPLLLSTTTRFRGTDGPLDAVDDPPVALGVSVDHIERKHRQHKLSLHCLE